MKGLEEIPGLREAVERETAAREFDFVGAPELVCGIELMPLTIRRLLRLQLVESPFLLPSARTVRPADVAAFFWALSPNYERALLVRQWTELVSYGTGEFVFNSTRRTFVRRLRRLPCGLAVREAFGYVDRAFEDAPGAGRSEGVAASYYGWPAQYIGLLAGEYGWTEDTVLDLPLRRLWQHVRRLIVRNDPQAILFNPSDTLRGQWLAKQNRN